VRLSDTNLDDPALGDPVRVLQPLEGGDINRAYAAELGDGRRVFVKTQDQAPQGFFAAEARGLAWLLDADAVRVPRVLARADCDDAEVPLLALEWIEEGGRGPAFDTRLGRALARLHAAGAEGFGLAQDGFIGSLPQTNAARPTWAAFYRECRLAPLVRRARDTGRLDADLAARFDVLFGRLEALVGPPEPPARLHGDLWSGNVLCDADAQPCLIDPAAYGGHREVDLAMLHLFGGAGERAFDAYDEAFPRAADHAERVALYQLYPLLVHLLLFGSAYRSRVAAAIHPYTH